MSRGRGRGRGRGRSFGNLDVLGIVPGEAPTPILQPPPLYPRLDRRPLELSNTETDEYLLSVKQDLRQFMKQSPFFLKAGSDKKEIQRYSDKYQEVKSSEIDNFLDWTPDWDYFPDELQIRIRKRKRPAGDMKHIPVTLAKRARKNRRLKELETVDEVLKTERKTTGLTMGTISANKEAKLNKTFEYFEKKEQREGENESGGEEEGEVIEDDDYYDEEIEEEGTDYNLTYFDPGEEYGLDDDDALEEGPYY